MISHQADFSAKIQIFQAACDSQLDTSKVTQWTRAISFDLCLSRRACLIYIYIINKNFCVNARISEAPSDHRLIIIYFMLFTQALLFKHRPEVIVLVHWQTLWVWVIRRCSLWCFGHELGRSQGTTHYRKGLGRVKNEPHHSSWGTIKEKLSHQSCTDRN